MRKSSILGSVVLIALSVAMQAAPASAQATRTWVSGVGNDADPCSRTAPCKTFAGAYGKTAASGIINCLDGGGFGGVTITKSLTLDCADVPGGILGAGGANGVVINGAGINVVLRGLTIAGAGSGAVGVNLVNAASLHIENVKINGFGNGLNVVPGAGVTSKVVVANSSISDNNGASVNIAPSGGTAKVLFNTVQVDNSTAGIYATAFGGGTTRMTIVNSSMSANNYYGIAADGTGGGTVSVMVDTSVVANNGTMGVYGNGASATVLFSKTTFAGNDTGWNASGGAQLLSYGDNNNTLNISANGPPSGAVLPRQ